MKKPLLLLLVTCLYKTAAFGQVFEWAKVEGDTTSINHILANDGVHTITAASFTGPLTLGNQTLSGLGRKMYVAKHDLAGNVLWAKKFTGISKSSNLDIETDINQNIIISGIYADSLQFANLIFKESVANDIKSFVVKLSPSGDLIWAYKLPFLSFPFRITTDGLGNVYLAHQYNSGLTIGSVTLIPPMVGSNVCFLKLNPNGTLAWVKNRSIIGQHFYPVIVGSNTDGFYLSNQFSLSGTNFGSELTKFDGAGNSVWSKTIQNFDVTYHLTIDSYENLILTGIGGNGTYQFGSLSLNLPYTGNSYGSNNFFNLFQAKINSAGTWLWAKLLATGNYSMSNSSCPSKIGHHTFGLTSRYTGTPTFGNVTLNATPNPVTNTHFYAKFDTTGNPIHAFTFSAPSYLYNMSLELDNNGNTYFGGMFMDSLNLANYTLKSNSNALAPFTSYVGKLINGTNTLSGTFFIDTNGNNLKDPGEASYKDGMLQINPFNLFVTTDSAGYFQAMLPGGNFNITAVRPDLHYTMNPNQHLISFTGTGQSQMQDIALTPIPNRNDVKISLINLTPARPGFHLQYRLTYQNLGTTTLSDTLALNFDGQKLGFVSASVNPNVQQGNVSKWRYQNLQPQEKRHIDVTFLVNGSVALGTVLNAYAQIKPNPDFVSSNNTDSLNHIVTGSYDPNDKQVNRNILSPIQVPTEYLDYTIRFQNTGTDTAFTVIIRDAITRKLFMPSLELLSASHNYTFKILENNVAEWRFDNILLPDSNRNEPASHGFVRFRIKPQNYLQLGDSITNYAAIYFDYNAPIITNTAVTRIMQPLGIKEEKAGLTTLYIYPNPATEDLTVEAELKQPQEATVILRNVLGQEVYRKHLGRQQQLNQKINIQQLPKGVYLLQLMAGSQQISRRVVVQ